MDFVRRLHAQDQAAGYAGTFLPRQLENQDHNDLLADRAGRDSKGGEGPLGSRPDLGLKPEPGFR